MAFAAIELTYMKITVFNTFGDNQITLLSLCLPLFLHKTFMIPQCEGSVKLDASLRV